VAVRKGTTISNGLVARAGVREQMGGGEHMRKLFALMLVALLALGLSLMVTSCGGGAQESSTAVEEAAPETPPMDDGMMADSTASDSEMGTEGGSEGGSEGGH